MSESDVNFFGSVIQKGNAECLGTMKSLRDLKSRDLPSYFKVGRKEAVLNALEVFQRDMVLGKSICWNMLLHLVRAMRVNCETAPECLKFLKELVSLFERYQCRDPSVMSEIFLAMLYLTNFSVPFKGQYQTIEMFKCFYMPYGTETKFQKGTDLAWNAARSANADILKLLLKYGIGIMTPHLKLYSFINEFEYLLFAWRNHTLRTFTNMRSDWTIYEKLHSVFNRESKKRLCLILRMLEIVSTMQRYTDFTEYFTACYRLLFDSIPEAYVTKVEVKAFLEKCLPDAYSALITVVTETFQRLLPELAEVPQPRNLQHLCRIQVRQSLRQNLNLPHGVSSLPLPTNLKKYIMLHDDGDYRVIIRTYKPIFHVGYRYCPVSVINIVRL